MNYNDIPSKMKNDYTKAELRQKTWRLTTDDKKFAIMWLSGKGEYTITAKGERYISQNLFNSRDEKGQQHTEIILSILKDHFYDALQEIKEENYKDEFVFLKQNKKSIITQYIGEIKSIFFK